MQPNFSFNLPTVQNLHIKKVEKTCTKCDLHLRSKSNCVSGKGSLNPKILFVGEGPGKDEDLHNEVFVGRAGQELDRLISEAKIDTSQIRFTNVTRCASKDFQFKYINPEKKHIDACRDHLLWELAKTKPEVIVCLGNSAIYGLFPHMKGGVKSLRTISHSFRFPSDFCKRAFELGYKLDEVEIPTIITFHPSYILRSELPGSSNQDKGMMIADLVVARRKAFKEDLDKKTNYLVYSKIEDIELFLNWLLDSYAKKDIDYIACDLETAGDVDRWGDKAGFKMFDPSGSIVTLQIAWDSNSAALIPIDHPESLINNPIDIGRLRIPLDKVFNTIPSAWQNGKFDYKWLYSKLSIRVSKFYFDTLLAHQTIVSGTEPNDLYYLSAKYLGVYGYGEKLELALSRLPKGYKSFKYICLADLLDYALGDAVCTFNLVPLLTEELKKKNLWDAYKLLYIETLEPIAHMEINGLKLNMEVYKWLKSYYPKVLASTSEPIKNSAFNRAFIKEIKKCPDNLIEDIVNGTAPARIQKKYEFNPGSYKQVAQLIYIIMKMPHPEDSDEFKVSISKSSGLPSTNKDHIRELITIAEDKGWELHTHLLQCFQEYLKVKTLNSNYVKNLMKVVEQRHPIKINPIFEPYIPAELLDIYYVHPQFQLEGTKTGRASAKDPAIHNIPYSSDIKKMYCSRWASQGGLWLAFDFAQTEVRILADVSGDQTLINIVNSDRDIHTEVACAIMKLAPEDVDPITRRKAKAANFAILYGAGPPKIARMARCTIEEAEEFLDKYLGTFPGVRKWKKATETFAEKNEYVKTRMGRIRILKVPINAGNRGLAKRRRQGSNAVIQGEASDHTLCCIKRVFRRIEKERLKSKEVLFKHDEIACDVYPGEFFKLQSIVSDEAVNGASREFPWLKVKLVADFEAGYSWGHCIEFKMIESNVYEFEGSRPKAEALFHQLKLSNFNLDIKPNYVLGIHTKNCKECKEKTSFLDNVCQKCNTEEGVKYEVLVK